MPVSSVVKVRGYCEGDSSPLSGRGVIFSLIKSECSDHWGNITFCPGKIRVVFPEELQLYQGEEVIVCGRFTADSALFVAEKLKYTWRWDGELSKFRASIIKFADYRFFAALGEAGGFLKALLLGIRDELPGKLFFDFRRAGVMHILALSGMHLGLLTALLSVLLYPVLGRKWTYPILACFLIVYLWLTGFKVSLLRAALMFWISGTGTFFGRKCTPLRSLGIAFLFSIIISPSGMFSPGFQLSFAALAGIFIFGLPLGKILSTRLPPWLFYPFGVSIGAQIATLPLLLIHFQEYVPTGIVCGLVITPLITLFMWTGIGLLILTIISPFFLTGMFSFLPELLYTLTGRTVEFFSGIQTLTISVSSAEKIENIVLLLLVLGGIIGLSRRGYDEYKLRFPKGASDFSGIQRTLHDKEVRSELPDQSTGKEQDH